MKKIIGVAACPAGIAHTYMAAESIERAGKSIGYEVKVETHGSAGVENRLTQEEIDDAEAVIIAADTTVEMERFRGKPLLEVSVKEAIRKIDKVIKKVQDGDISVY